MIKNYNQDCWIVNENHVSYTYTYNNESELSHQLTYEKVMLTKDLKYKKIIH